MKERLAISCRLISLRGQQNYRERSQDCNQARGHGGDCDKDSEDHINKRRHRGDSQQ
jgi:hypothetical protein